MDKKRTAFRAGAVLMVALGAGHMVQRMAEDTPPAGASVGNVETVSAGKPAPLLPGAASLAEPVAAEPSAADIAPSGALTDDAAAQPVPVTLPEDAEAAGTALAETAEIAPESPADGDAPGLSLAAPAPDAPEAAAPEQVAYSEDAPTPPAPSGTLSEASPAEPPATTAEPACEPVLTVTAAAGALLSLRLEAPCNPGESVTLLHGGLTIAEALDAGGVLELDLPALDARGEVIALFDTAGHASAAAAVEDLAQYRRFVVQWMEDDVFQLHALENGADYGMPGDVNAANPVSPDGGYLMRLGNPDLPLAMMAEVYTWPRDATVMVTPVIESLVSEATCNRELMGEALSLAGGKVKRTDLTLAMPGCDAVGDILVLNNLVPELTLTAAN